MCLLKHNRPMSSGLCFALGTALKISPVVAVPLLALRRQWRWLGAYMAGVAACTGVSIWWLGWKTNLIWLRDIYPCISTGLGNNLNRSFAGLVDVLAAQNISPRLSLPRNGASPPGWVCLRRLAALPSDLVSYTGAGAREETPRAWLTNSFCCPWFTFWRRPSVGRITSLLHCCP